MIDGLRELEFRCREHVVLQREVSRLAGRVRVLRLAGEGLAVAAEQVFDGCPEGAWVRLEAMLDEWERVMHDE